MREHLVPCDNLIPVQPFETHKTTLELIEGHFFIKTVVGDLQQLERYDETGIIEED